MKYVFLFLLLIAFTGKSFSQSSCIDVGVVVDGDMIPQIFSNVMFAGSRFLACDGGGKSSYGINDYKQFRMCNGIYGYFNVSSDPFYKSSNVQGTHWSDGFGAVLNPMGHIDHYDLMVKNNLVTPDGYPKQLPVTMPSADSSFNIEIGYIYRQLNFPTGYPRTGWVLRYKGKGEIAIQGIMDVKRRTSNVSGITWMNSTGGNVRMEIELNGQNPMTFTINSSDKSDPIRDIELLYPGTEPLVNAGNDINPMYIDKVKNFKVLRFRDILGARFYKPRVSNVTRPNWDYWVAHTEWSDRIKPGWYWQASSKGVAYEYLVQICNQAKANPWICMPFSASADYAKNCAQTVMSKLDPDLSMYIEVGSNMLNWNDWGGNSGYNYQNAMAQTFYAGLNDQTATGAFLNDAFKGIAIGAGGKNLKRIKRVFSPYPGYSHVNNIALLQIDINNWECFPIGWDFGITEGTRAALLNYINTHPGDQAGFNQLMLDSLRANFKTRDKWSADVLFTRAYNKEVVFHSGGTRILRDCGGSCLNGPNCTQIEDEGTVLTGLNPMRKVNYPTVIPALNAFFNADTSQAMYEFLNDVIDTMQNNIRAGAVCYRTFASTPQCRHSDGLIFTADIDKPYDTLYKRNGRFRAFADRKANSNCDLAYQIASNNIGAGLAAMLDGSNDYALMSTAYIPDESTSYTLEGWFLPNYVGDTDQTLFSMATSQPEVNYNTVKIKKDGKLNWTIGSYLGQDVNLTGPVIPSEKWIHVAITKQDRRYTLYLNGVNVASGNFILKKMTRNQFASGASVYSSYVSNYFYGNMDEIRLWNTYRSENDIRQFMCKRVTALNCTVWSNLKTYYRFDTADMSTNKLFNFVNKKWEGTLKNVNYNRRSGYSTSGAPIGDYSICRYTGTWTNVSVSMTHPQGDMLAVTNIGNGNPEGMHIYYVESAARYNLPPDYYDGISNNRYWGVFAANGTNPSFDVAYYYKGNPQAKLGGDETMNRLLRRNNANDTSWLHSGANRDLIQQSLYISCKEFNRGEYTLAFRKDNSVNRPGSGKALHFVHTYHSNDDGIKHGATFFTPFMRDYTLCFWAKGSSGEVMSFSSMGGDNHAISAGGNPARLAVRWNPVNSDDPLDGLNVGEMGSNTDWIYYTVVKKGQKISLYINGILLGSKDFIGEYLIKKFSFLSPGGVYPADIYWDELLLFNTALDQKTIRDWMCKRFTGDHPYACSNLVFAFNFDEGQGSVLEDKHGPNDMVMNDMSLITYENSGAPLGDVSSHNYNTPYNITLSHPNGDYLEGTSTGGTPMGVHLYRVDDMPPVTSAVDEPSIVSMDSTRYWGIFPIKRTTATAPFTVINHYEKNGKVKTESELRILNRTDGSVTPWHANLSILPNTTNHTLTLTGQTRMEYVLGGTSVNTFTAYTPPVVPVFSPETSRINVKTICGNSVNMVYKVIYDPNASSYKWKLPVGLDGFSTADSIVINANYLGATAQTFTISVTALNQKGESPAATYTITVNPPTTIADAGPDITLMPPAKTTMMDGNKPASGESALWQLVTGRGSATIVTPSDPKTVVNNIGNGYNYFLYTITNPSCPASTDSMRIVIGPPPVDVTLLDDSPLPKSVCEGITLTIKVVPAPGFKPTRYEWIMPSGLKMISQTGPTAIIYADKGFGGPIKVSAVYNTSLSDPFVTSAIQVNQKPNDPVLIEKPTNICWQHRYTYSCNIDATIDSFNWILPKNIYPTKFPKPTGNSIEINVYASDASGFIKVQAFNGSCTSPTAFDSVEIHVDSTPPKPSMTGHPYRNLSSDGRMCYSQELFFVSKDDSLSHYNWYFMNHYEDNEANVKFLGYLDSTHSAVLYDFSFYNTNRLNWYVRRVRGTGECNESGALSGGTWVRWKATETFLADVPKLFPDTASLMNLKKGCIYNFYTGGGIDFISKYRIFFWVIPPGLELQKDANLYDSSITVKVIGDFAGYLDVYGLSWYGCTQGKNRAAVGSGNVPLPPEYVSGNSACQGQPFAINVQNVGADEYIWTFPDGSKDVTVSNIYSKTATKVMKGQMTVVARRGTKYSTPVRFNLAVRPVNLPPLTFFNEDGDTINFFEVCTYGRSTQMIKISDIGATKYEWKPSGSQIYASGTKGIFTSDTVWGIDTISYWHYGNLMPQAAGYLKVTSKNDGCGPSRVDSILHDFVTPAGSQQPTFVNPPSALCIGSKATFRIKPLKDVSKYIWSLPSGLSAPSLITTVSEIVVNVSAGVGGRVEVHAVSTAHCGESPFTPTGYCEVTIGGAPTDMQFTRAPLSACGVGDTLTFGITPVKGISKYYWNVPGPFSETIVDDSDSLNIYKVGNWTKKIVVSPPFPYKNVHYTAGQANLNYKFYFVADLPFSAKYKVELFWTTGSKVVPITVVHKNGTSTFPINQYNLYGLSKWNEIGTFEFEKGRKDTVIIGTTGVAGDWTLSVADAVRFTADTITGDTAMSFRVNSAGTGAICVTAVTPQCPTGFTICTDPINTTGNMSAPYFITTPSNVCAGRFYTYVVSNCGAETYTWYLPDGMSIDGKTGTVTGRSFSANIRIDKELTAPVKIAVQGHACGASTIIDTSDAISMSKIECPLADPYYDRSPDSVCTGSITTYSVLTVPGAVKYEWTLPDGISLSPSGKTGVIITDSSHIQVSVNKAGTLNSILVKAIGSDPKQISNAIPSGAIASIDVTPSVTISPEATCPDDSSTIMFKKDNNFNYAFDIKGAVWIDSTKSEGIRVKWGSGPTGTITLKVSKPSIGCSSARVFNVNLSKSETKITCPADILETVNFDKKTTSLYSFVLKDTLKPIITSRCGWTKLINDYDSTKNAFFDSIRVAIIDGQATAEQKIKWTVYDKSKNTDSCIFRLRLRINMDLAPFTAFTPNGDGENELFTIGNIEYYPESIVQIFDRWGQLVFECKTGCDSDANKWNGIDLKGNKVLPDSYHYTITQKGKVIKVGFVTVIR